MKIIANVYFLLIFFVIASFLYSKPVLALTFSPVKIFVNLEKNEQIKKTVKIFNENSDRIKIHANLVDFSEGDRPGVPLFTTEELPTGIHSLISLPITDLSLESKETREFSFLINNSNDFVSGSYYGAIHFTTITDSNNGAVSASAATGPLIFITLKNNNLPSISTKLSTPLQSYYSSHPTNLSLQINNKGDAIVMPSGAIIVKNFFGNIARKYSLKPDGSVILPNGTREYHANTNSSLTNKLTAELSNFGLGKYSLEFQANLNAETPILINLGKYWIFPWRLAILLLLSILMLSAFSHYLHRYHTIDINRE